MRGNIYVLQILEDKNNFHYNQTIIYKITFVILSASVIWLTYEQGDLQNWPCVGVIF